MPPRLQVTSVTINTENTRRLAEFYASLLNTEISTWEPPREGMPAEAGWAQVRTTSDAGQLTLNFEYDRAFAPAVWPSETGKPTIQEHLDILVDDLDAAVAWAEECGAKQAEFQPQETVRVMIDPSGHPFCLFVAG